MNTNGKSAMSATAIPGADAIARILRPRSIAVVGASAQPGSMGATVVAALIASGYSGELYIVSRSASEIEGRACIQAIDDLPEGIDLVVLVVGSAAAREAITTCVRRKAHAAVIFASGFAELSDEGRAEQEAIGRIAAEGGIALIGPNCLGFTNHLEGFGIGFATRSAPTRTGEGPAVAMVGQSGALLGHLTHAFTARNISITYSVSTGNEAQLGVQDFIPYLADDPRTRAIVVFAEQIRRPDDFLAAVAYARAQGKPVILMHSCRSARAQEAGRAHTGALPGNYDVMRTFGSHAGAVLVDSLEQLVDVAQILARFPQPPTAGVGIMTVSGAFCGIGLDACDKLGLDVPLLATPTLATLREIMPPFAAPCNPLDLTTQVMREPELLAKTADALLADPNIGSVLAVLMPGGTPQQATRFLKGILPAIKNPAKPLVLAMMGDGSFLDEEFATLIRENSIVLSRSPERSLRAIAPVTAYGRWCAAHHYN
jgi:acyl-CoA synthetase (NDP forming)